jgi:hypothetical protein
MAMRKENNTMKSFNRAAIALTIAGSGVFMHANAHIQEVNPPMTAAQPQFYCNAKALNPQERTGHKELTDKIIATRNNIVEMPKGYEFQFNPAKISMTELAQWAAAESKCCPFFDFHIDLEREGKLLCLRLTGRDGIKPFIRGEFQVPAE